MHPILFEIGGFPIHSYGILVALGFLAGTAVIRQGARKRGWDTETVVDFCFLCLLVGFLGCRVFFVLTQLSYFAERPLEIFYIWEGGMVFYGGPIFVVPWAFWYIRRKKLKFRPLADLCMQGLTLGHAIGRLGCLAAGCCYGGRCDLPWAVRLHSELVDIHLRGLPLHPTQIYEAVLLLALFFFLRWVDARKRFDGQVMLVYFMIYPLLRSFVEIFRGDEVRGFVVPDIISTSQFISILVFIAAAVVYRRWRKA